MTNQAYHTYASADGRRNTQDLNHDTLPYHCNLGGHVIGNARIVFYIVQLTPNDSSASMPIHGLDTLCMSLPSLFARNLPKLRPIEAIHEGAFRVRDFKVGLTSWPVPLIIQSSPRCQFTIRQTVYN